jgi:plasmid stabilization system protein ParE
MNITWRPHAADDFEKLISSAAGSNVAAASRDKSLVENGILKLVRFKELGRKTRRLGVREFAIEGTPYIVVNRRLGDDILILRLFHSGKATIV